jgi:3-oxoacyl-[acyl-carrier-protein] synthase III
MFSPSSAHSTFNKGVYGKSIIKTAYGLSKVSGCCLVDSSEFELGGHGCPTHRRSAAPNTVVTNADLEGFVETSDEWIRTRTGIQERRVLTKGETLRDLSIQAAKDALEMAGVAPEELGLVICASSSPDDLFGDAPSIANKLGCNSNTIAYDLVAACSGFLFGVVTASKFLSAPGSQTTKALVIGADSLSRWIDWDDRNSCILFGDGAGAMVLEASDAPGILGYAAHSNGGGYCDLNARYVT